MCATGFALSRVFPAKQTAVGFLSRTSLEKLGPDETNTSTSILSKSLRLHWSATSRLPRDPMQQWRVWLGASPGMRVLEEKAAQFKR